MSLPLLLRHTRASKNISQLDLSLRLGVSQRHVSFLETGRAAPSRDLLLAWMNEVEAPTSLRNAALSLGGFTTVASEEGASWIGMTDANEAALQRMVQLHNPLPGLVFDPDWKMLATNCAGQWLCTVVMPGYCEAVDHRFEGLDMIDCVAHDDGLLSHSRNAAQVGASLLAQLQTESWLRPSLRPRVDRLADSLHRRYGRLPEVPSLGLATPSLNLSFDTPLGVLNFSTFQSAFGIPQDINSSSLRIELWFAADAHTREVMSDADADAEACC
ncbi:Helix-turn-helix [Variovorax sp. PDC80]|uniref:MmyB family transcriptional regulator n=1 Tax=Variovorax sp. PDC80 TaxID=1882827 RepID=UPI0008F251F1|nr:helix-turn-helix domain-containing protein [Variovorax sp. PDC80]SFQ02970.1 Helix-turn-helix [Variovorax sp. PDC80]